MKRNFSLLLCALVTLGNARSAEWRTCEEVLTGTPIPYQTRSLREHLRRMTFAPQKYKVTIAYDEGAYQQIIKRPGILEAVHSTKRAQGQVSVDAFPEEIRRLIFTRGCRWAAMTEELSPETERVEAPVVVPVSPTKAAVLDVLQKIMDGAETGNGGSAIRTYHMSRYSHERALARLKKRLPDKKATAEDQSWVKFETVSGLDNVIKYFGTEYMQNVYFGAESEGGKIEANPIVAGLRQLQTMGALEEVFVRSIEDSDYYYQIPIFIRVYTKAGKVLVLNIDSGD